MPIRTFYAAGMGAWAVDQALIDSGDYAPPAGAVEIAAAPGADHKFDGQAWVADPDAAADARAGMEANIRAEAERRMRLIADGVRDGEMQTWRFQVAEAEAWQADNTVATPSLDVLLVAGETKAQLVAKILAKSAAFLPASVAIIGAQRALLAMDPIPDDYADNKWWPQP